MEADVTEGDGSPARWGRPRASSLAVLGFALALSSTTLIYPLLALDAGYSAVVIGVFTSISAGAQLVSRLGLPWLLARIPDRAIVGGAAILMAGSAGALVLTTGVSAFILAQLLQGTARALFWTASQTHAVRTPGIALRRLAQVQVASHSGALVGPVVTGVIASRSLRLALGLTIAGALAAATTSMFMSRLEPYQRKARGGRASWRRSLGATGYWTSFAGGVGADCSTPSSRWSSPREVSVRGPSAGSSRWQTVPRFSPPPPSPAGAGSGSSPSRGPERSGCSPAS